MSIENTDIVTYFTTGSASAGDQLIPQNNKLNSLGGTCSTTKFLSGINNTFPEWTTDELTASEKYVCLCLTYVNELLLFETVRLLAKDIDTYPSGVTITIGLQTNDDSTAAPICADGSTAPAGITFVPLAEWTGNLVADKLAAYPLGPLNSPADGATDLDFEFGMRVFLYIKFVCNNSDSLDDLSFSMPLIGLDNSELDYELNWILE